MSNYQVRRLDRDSAQAWVDQLVKIDQSIDWQHWREDQVLSDLPMKWELSLVALDGDSPVGFLLASRKGAGAHIHRLVVSATHRGQRIGAALIEQLSDTVGNCKNIQPILTLKVERTNTRARKFYKANGFRPRIHFGTNDVESLWKPIGSGSFSYGVHQPNFLPWQGYFSKIIATDAFIILDDVQMPQGRSYVARTRIRKGEDDQWLTVPVNKVSLAPINQIKIAGHEWIEKHLSLLGDRYRRWPYFDAALPLIKEQFQMNYHSLWEMNVSLIGAICSYIGVDRVFELSSIMKITESSDDRIIRIGEAIGAKRYLSGMGGVRYQSEQKFKEAGIILDLLKVKDFAPENGEGGPAPRLGYSIIEALFAFPPEKIKNLLEETTVISPA